MTQQDKEFYDALLDLFMTKGWKYFIEEIDKYRQTAQESWHTLETDKDFFIRRGNLETLNYVVNFEQMAKHAYDEARKEDADI